MMPSNRAMQPAGPPSGRRLTGKDVRQMVFG